MKGGTVVSDKITKSQKLKLLGSFVTTVPLGVLAVLAIIIYLNSTFGWFANNKQVSGRGMQTTINAPDAEAEYTVYLFDAKLNDVRYTGDSYTPAGSDPKLEDMKMQVHDVIFKSRNRYTPAVIHIHLSDIKEEYRTNGTVSLTLTRDSSAAYEVSGNELVLPDKTTSILRFTLLNNKGTSWLSQNSSPNVAANETYTSVDNALYTKIVTNKNYTDESLTYVDSNVFTTVTKDVGGITDITKSPYLTLTVSYTAAQVTNGELDLFLYLTYDDALVSDFEQAAGIDTDSTSVGRITTLYNDLTNLEIHFNSN